jgi:hypothetical protein
MKFYCIMLLKDISETKNKAFMNYLEKKLLKRLIDFVKLSKKNVEYRAKELSKEINLKSAEDFWQILMECIKIWSNDF